MSKKAKLYSYEEVFRDAVKECVKDRLDEIEWVNMNNDERSEIIEQMENEERFEKDVTERFEAKRERLIQEEAYDISTDEKYLADLEEKKKNNELNQQLMRHNNDEGIVL